MLLKAMKKYKKDIYVHGNVTIERIMESENVKVRVHKDRKDDEESPAE